MDIKKGFFYFSLLIFVFGIVPFVSAAYMADIYFTVPDGVYTTGERIELRGYVYQTSNSSSTTLLPLASANVNITIRNINGVLNNAYNVTTNGNGTFFSRSNYYTRGLLINSPSVAGDYYIRAEYIDPQNSVWFSEVEISVLNQTLDVIRVSSDKAAYNPSEIIKINVEASKSIGDRTLYVSNISVNGSITNSSKSLIQNFNCTTGSNGKCTVSLNAPSSYGNYFVEVEDFKAFGSFLVIPFSYNIYMKDELGKSLKNVFASGEQAKVEVKINNASDSDIYSFSGYIRDSAGNVKEAITSTTLNNNNSFTGSFLFTVDTTFGFGSYTASVTVAKSGDGSMTSQTAFQVKDWVLSVDKKSVGSGFEYEYSSFPNKTLKFEAMPTYRVNGSVVPSIESSSFTVELKDNLNNVMSSGNSSWNASCGSAGCYEFSIVSPVTAGEYALSTTLSYGGAVQTESRIINVIEGVMSAQSTDKDGNIKELVGTNEYAYISLSAYNLTSSGFNLTNAEVFSIVYMNGTEFSYTEVASFDLVNSSNNNYEWAWNSTLQMLKIDVPKVGGLYNIYVFGNNRTLGANAKFIVNPYDVCTMAKNTPGTVSGSGYYYVWQFKKTDTIYFEIKAVQANNPSGRATAENSSSGNSSYGRGSACSYDTTQKQVVTNATITILEAVNTESGERQALNTSSSICQSSDSSGGYSCTVQPLSKWSGGPIIVKFDVMGQDGTSDVAYGRFEARAFYLYGWSQTWQNNPSSNITLNVQMYEAGSNWWGSSGGLSGTVTVKKVEYQGRDGEWLASPVDSGYNVSNVNSSSITSSSNNNNIALPASYALGGVWKTGYYRAILQATTTSGDTDYGYAWFGVKLWDVYGSPIECTSTSCSYKSYFNSKENITLYVTITKAGSNWWSSNSGGQDIYGNVTVGIKKIENCKSWPCKELNSSQYSANSIVVNASSSGYWYSGVNQSSVGQYLIQINSSTGTWNTGYYNVVLDVNGTDTGYAGFQTIAFYVETQPTDANGSSYKYSIRGNQQMYFNVSTTKSYKWLSSYWSSNQSMYIYSRYNETDYVNTTIEDIILRTWDQTTWQSKEYNYPQDLNITLSGRSDLVCPWNCLVNLTFLNGTWPTGYYNGELTLRNFDNETSTGWLWFNVQPFRVNVNTIGNTYNMDSEECVNATLSVYDPDWSSSTVLYGNYSVVSVYEDIWSGYGSSKTSYGNFTINTLSNASSFNSTSDIVICPNAGKWGGGSWGGYHYLNIVVKDNIYNDSQSGWLSFRTVPFSVSWGSVVGNVMTNRAANVSVTLSKPSGGSTRGNLTRMYQWRYDNVYNGLEEYVFKVESGGVTCYSNVSSQCTVNGSATTITVYPTSRGWKTGYNYLQADWASETDSSSTLQDWSGIYFEGKTAYNGYFANVNSNGNYKYDFATSENITIRLYVRDADYAQAGTVTISSVEYAYSGTNCWDDWCRTYTSAVFSPTSTTNGEANLQIKAPSSNWTKGNYAIRASISGSGGSATITGGTVKVKDTIPPNITLSAPQNNVTYGNSMSFSATTNENARCTIYLVNYDNFFNWYCSGWGSTNSTNSSSSNVTVLQFAGACNRTLYSYNGSRYHNEYLSADYHSIYDGENSTYCYSSSNSEGYSCYSYPDGLDTTKMRTFMTTGGLTHSYTINTTGWTSQNYGMQMWCNDDDNNYVSTLAAFKVINT